jgi:hypothetical protein
MRGGLKRCDGRLTQAGAPLTALRIKVLREVLCEQVIELAQKRWTTIAGGIFFSRLRMPGTSSLRSWNRLSFG